MKRVMVRNPESGRETDSETAAEIARDRGIVVRDSSEPGEPVSIARRATDEADQILACGGDGTVNEVVCGVDDANALSDVELAVVPTGTGNDFASNVGIESVEHAFDVATDGEVRQLDLGMADGSPFVNSCLGGLVAEASDNTSEETKARLGSLAYAVQMISELREYEGPMLEVTVGEADDPLWIGESVALLVGNARRFAVRGRTQAAMEDDLLEVVIVEHAPAIDYLANDALGQLFDNESSNLTKLTTSRLAVSTGDGAMEFSLDGEVIRRDALETSVRPEVLQFRVGPAYEPKPSPWIGG